MKTKVVLVAGLIVGGAISAMGWLRYIRPEQRETAAPNTALVHAPEPALAHAPKPPEEPLPPAETAPPLPDPSPAPVMPPAAPAGKIAASASLPPASTLKTTAKPPGKPKRTLADPTARVAMSYVGADADAEAYWLEAIFDSSLPDKEREDLMEDLNEEGLSDHKLPGPEDFPLIMNRLAIIEQIAPEADEFMLRHLREAYKDLVNLANITQGGGSPVR